MLVCLSGLDGLLKLGGQLLQGGGVQLLHPAVKGDKTVDLVLHVGQLGVDGPAQALGDLRQHPPAVERQNGVLQLGMGAAGAVAVGLVGVEQVTLHRQGP